MERELLGSICYLTSDKKAWWRPLVGCIQWECGPLPLTLKCVMMISTRNRDEKYGPPFVNSLGLRRP